MARFARVEPDLVAKPARFGAATLHEAAGKVGALPSAIPPHGARLPCRRSGLHRFGSRRR